MSEHFLTCRKPKDPSDSDVYAMDWTNALNTGETISASTWVFYPPNILVDVADSIAADGLSTAVQLSGGLAGQDYWCENTVETTDGRTLQRTGVLNVREL